MLELTIWDSVFNSKNTICLFGSEKVASIEASFLKRTETASIQKKALYIFWTPHKAYWAYIQQKKNNQIFTCAQKMKRKAKGKSVFASFCVTPLLMPSTFSGKTNLS